MINTYFDKIYVLNLFKRKDRLISSNNRYLSNGLKFEVFNGCDGSVMNHLWKKLDNENFSNPNYVGCAISHLSIYQDAILNGYKKILILEDDCLVNKNYQSIFSTLDIPEWDDLMYLGYIPLNDDCSMWTYENGVNPSNVINSKYFKPNNLWGLFAYGIGISLMKELVNRYNDDFPMELDRLFVNDIQKRGKSIAIFPQLFCCDDDIFSDNLNYSPGNMKLKSIDTRYANLEDYR